ncbi:hypothetical protein Ddye_020088 [Dipteronia dyeriana]|uniref:Reverse transcriptase zinc-binding domain-containing protein n=1 Tax=Dipteronia dyeriana TaxID=168575 RepID=A0AAD9TZJ8_9ROSI|nr:hypothetical protein Ddye_020088 [Dipteronia dyeriana]
MSLSASNSLGPSGWWTILWNLKLPPKVRIFVWRACLNALPAMENLWKKKVVASPQCNRCATPVETTSHAVFGCKKAKKAWSYAHFDSLLATGLHLFILDIILFASTQIGKDALGRLYFVHSKCAISTCAPISLPWGAPDWLAPPPDRLKPNIVVAFRKFANSVGIGATIKDDKGRVLVARSNQFSSSFSYKVSELVALR